MAEKLLVVDVAALGYDFVRRHLGRFWRGEEFRSAESIFPAVTCSVQAGFRTAAPASEHGMIANGRYFPSLHRVMFWEQSSDLVAGGRIWDDLRRRGKRVAMLFWQQSLGESVDWVLSPAPIHKHHGGMILDCYSQPPGLYPRLRKKLGEFQLGRYWGPMASAKVGDWIARATGEVLRDDDAPELIFSYLPSLDYDLQRHGPDDDRSKSALQRVFRQLGTMLEAADAHGYATVLFGDYAIGPAERAVLPNRRLMDDGWFAVRNVRGRWYPDFHASRAFAMVDHEIAHIFVSDDDDLRAVESTLQQLDGVGQVLHRSHCPHLNSPHAGSLILVAEPGAWFAYPWWNHRRQEPDFASHVDIHNKPGFDPCELHFGWPPPSVSRNPARIAGSHGRTGPDRTVAWWSTVDLPAPRTLLELASVVKDHLSMIG